MEIEGFDNYLIYEDGSVYSKKRKKVLKPANTGNGYLQVQLCKDGTVKMCLVHRLVGLTYIPNPHNYEQIDHIDRDRCNNHLYNLRWVNYSMNNQNTEVRKNNKLGTKNISKSTNIGYMFQKIVNGKNHRKWFKTLEEAIKYKEEYLANLQLE